MIIQDSARKLQDKTKIKMVTCAGSPAEEYRVKRLLDPDADITKLKHAQLVTLVEKQQIEISSQQQTLDIYHRAKSANRDAANQWLKRENELKAELATNRDLLSTLRATNLAQTTELNKQDTLSVNQDKLITDLSTAKKELIDKVSTMDQALQAKSSELVTLEAIYKGSKDNPMVSEQTGANLRDDIIALNKTIEEDEDALAEGWKKISSQQDVKSNSAKYEKLWKKSTASRQLEQESTQALMTELKEAEQTIARL